MNSLQLDLAQIERLVDAEFLLRADDPILRGLREIKPAPPVARSFEIISSLFDSVDLDLDAGFLLECGDEFGGHVIGPGDDAQFLTVGLDCAGPEAKREHQRGRQEVFHRFSPRLARASYSIAHITQS